MYKVTPVYGNNNNDNNNNNSKKKKRKKKKKKKKKKKMKKKKKEEKNGDDNSTLIIAIYIYSIKWKAIGFQQFFFYAGAVIIRVFNSQNVLKFFSLAVSILVNSEIFRQHVDYGKQLLVMCVENKVLYARIEHSWFNLLS